MSTLAVGLRTIPVFLLVGACATPQEPEVPSPLPIPHPGPTTGEAPATRDEPPTKEAPTPTPPPRPGSSTGAGSSSSPIDNATVGPPLQGSISTDRRGNPMEPIPIADLRLDDARGHWLVLHFAHGWCPTCDQVARNLDEIASLYRAQGVLTIVVTADSSLWKRKVASDIAVVDEEALADKYAGETAIVDPGGGLHLLTSQPIDTAQVDKLVASNAVKDPVRVTVTSTPVNAGGNGSIAVTFECAPGHHVMSHQPTRASYFALRVNARDKGGVRAGEPEYPPSESAVSAGDTVAVNSGKFVVAIPFTVDASAPPGPVTIPLDVRYQACTDRVCLFPVDSHPKAVVDVK